MSASTYDISHYSLSMWKNYVTLIRNYTGIHPKLVIAYPFPCMVKISIYKTIEYNQINIY